MGTGFCRFEPAGGAGGLADRGAAGTISASYELGVNLEVFTIYCQGNHHKSVGLPTNYPQYSSVQA